MRLIIMTGLPGTGKSTVASAISSTLLIPIFAKDWLDASLRASGIVPELSAYASYDLLTTLAHSQLQGGQSAILDSVATPVKLREKWRELATSYQAQFYVIACHCSDETLHRKRLNTRHRDIPGWHELTWAKVERVRAGYLPWQGAHLLLDASVSLENNISHALKYISEPPPPAT